MIFEADLHIHSHFSDGTHTPSQIIDLAHKKGLSAISITDHDTIAAYSEELFDIAKKNHIELIPGVEVSSSHKKEEVHILGYNIDLKEKRFHEFLGNIQKLRDERNKAMLERCRSMGMAISDEEFFALKDPKTRVLGRPHIAYLLKQKKYVENEKEAFQKYLRKHASCYVAGEKYSSIEVIGQIHLAGGKAILAHPHFIRSHKTLSELMAMPFDGLECHYGLFSKEDNERMIKLAREKKWIVTGGSDFHGDVKPHLPIGASTVGKEAIEKILA